MTDLSTLNARLPIRAIREGITQPILQVCL